MKIVVVGEWFSGKTSLISSLTNAGIFKKVSPEVTCLLEAPGLGKIEGEDRRYAITKRMISENDLVLFVVTHEVFQDKRITNFLVETATQGKTHVILNKIDRGLIDLSNLFGYFNIPVSQCSTGQYLKAEREFNKELFQKSKITELIHDLSKFTKSMRIS